MKANKLYFRKENTSNSEGKLKIQEKPVFTKRQRISNIIEVFTSD